MGSTHDRGIIIFLAIFITGLECSRFMGCYRDISSTARLMHGEHREFRGTLTPEKCISHCKSRNFAYVGMEYGYECFCSNDRPSFKYLADPGECFSKCDGDKAKTCGGNWRLTVFDIENKRVNYVQAQYRGCFSDDGERRRALDGMGPLERGEMTPEFCVGYCFRHGYRYAGVQNRNQCYCGDEVHGSMSNEGECDFDCAGDSRLLCGGEWRNSVYHTSIADESESGQFLGCFEDSKGRRVLSGKFLVLKETNSPRRCFNICSGLGFQYAGVENGDECFCGNVKPEGDRERNEYECHSACPRTSHQACGGEWRLAVYQTSTVYHEAQIPPGGGVGYPEETTRREEEKKSTTQKWRPPVEVVPATPRPGVQQNQPWLTSSKPQQNQAWGSSTTRRAQPIKTWVTTSTQRPLVQQATWQTAGGWSQEETQYCTKSKTEHAGKSLCQGDLLFQERFNAWTPGRWKHEIIMPDEPDYEFVVYDDKKENVYLQNGNLGIRPTIFDNDFVRDGKLRLEKCTGRLFTSECEREARGFTLLPPVRSARITTKESFTFKYGKVVINARLPAGDWIVPEIWLEPKDQSYGPFYQSGRIRIAASLGNHDLVSGNEEIGCKRLQQGIIMGPTNVKTRSLNAIKNQNRGWFEDFHNYTLIWTPDNISFQVDEEERVDLIQDKAKRLYQFVGFNRNEAGEWLQGSSIAPFDQQFYITLGVSVGGMREFPDNCITGRRHAKPWDNLSVKGLVDFWSDRDSWYPTWNNNKFGLEVAEVLVYAL